jgi:DNA ligase (NAD+)
MFAYSMVGGPPVASQEELLALLHSWGFSISELVGVCEGADEMLAYYADVVAQRPHIDYDLDGVVYKLDDVEARLSMGETSRTPRWAVAHKFEAEKAVTRLDDIVIQVGRTGVQTPVAVLQPVAVGGVVVSRATLHNAQEVARKDVRVGDMVTIQRAGDVIPQVLGHVAGTRDPAAPAWSMPTKCQSCGSDLVQTPGEVAIRCTAAFSCPAQRVERLQYMASRDVLDIKGLGEQNVQMLVDAGLLDRPGDVFRIPANEEAISKLPGMGKRSAEILVAGVELRRSAPLDRFIAALGMREVGGSTAKLLAGHAGSAAAFLSDCRAIASGDEATVAAYRGIDQVGPAVTDAIAEHFGKERSAKDAEDLASEMRVPDFKVATGPFKGMTIVFSGTLEKTDRSGAKAVAESMGAKVAGSVSKKTSLLVAGPGAGAKLADAEKHKVRVLDEDGWLRLVESSGNAG